MAQTILDNKGWTVNGQRQGRWSPFSDTVYAATDGIKTTASTINTLTGNDNLIGTATTTTGGTGFDNPVAGVWVVQGTRLNLGFGDDQIIGQAPVIAGSFNYGVYNEGAIDTGYGNDLIQGTSRFGISNTETGTINMGDGNDQIIGESSDAGTDTSDYALINKGFINMGAGRDSIIGSNSHNGIFNSGTITMGEGADTVDALIGGASGTPGGFQGGGLIDFGRGNDVLKGFGEGTFKGGAGTDSLVLQDGVYTVVADGSNFTIAANAGAPIMTINSFEKIAGANAAFQDLTAGTYTISGGLITLFTP